MRSFALILAAAAFLAACGDDSSGGGGGGGTTVRCLWVDDTCDQITGVMTAAQQTDLDGSCTGGGGEFAVGACSTSGAVAGYCYYTGTAVGVLTGVEIAGATVQEYYYSAGGWTSPDGEAYCALYPPGTWVP